MDSVTEVLVNSEVLIEEKRLKFSFAIISTKTLNFACVAGIKEEGVGGGETPHPPFPLPL